MIYLLKKFFDGVLTDVYKDEKGAILLLVLLIFVVFLIITGSFMIIINNEFEIMNYNQDRIQASYNAEVAVNKAIRMINENGETSVTDLEAIKGELIEENDYYIKEADKFLNENDQLYYRFIAAGRSGTIISDYNVTIEFPKVEEKED